MARYYGMRLAEVRAMLWTDFFMLDGFLERHPPIDLIAAAYFGVKPKRGKMSIKEAAKVNARGLSVMPPRKLAVLPERLQRPEIAALIEKMRADWQAANG